MIYIYIIYIIYIYILYIYIHNISYIYIYISHVNCYICIKVYMFIGCDATVLSPLPPPAVAVWELLMQGMQAPPGIAELGKNPRTFVGKRLVNRWKWKFLFEVNL